MEGEPLAMALLSQQLAAVLEHNGISSADEAFPLFDLDQDERISVSDLFDSCTEVQVQTSSEQVAAWIAHHAQQEDKSFLTLSAWCAALRGADGKQILKSFGVSKGLQLEMSRLQNTSNIISTLLMHKGINADDGFSSFDADADGKLSMADLDLALTERLSLDAVHVHELAVWFRHYNIAGDGFMTPQEWRTALNHADPTKVASLEKHNSKRIIEEQDEIARREQIQMESLLQQADSLLSSGAANVHGSLHAANDDSESSTSDSPLASSPPSSAGSGGSFELESEPLRTAGAPTINTEQAALRIQSLARGTFARQQVAVKKQESWKVRREQAAIKIQARARGMQTRNMRANTHQNLMKASAGKQNRVSACNGLKNVVSEDEVRQMKAQHQVAIQHQAAVSIQKRARGMLARSNFRPSVSAGGLRRQTPSTHAGTTYSGSGFEHDEKNYEEEFEDEGEPRWIGAECDGAAQLLQAFCRTQISMRDLAHLRGGSKLKKELLRRDTITHERYEAREAEFEKQREERIRSETSSVISVQIDMIEADWAAAKKHKSVLKYATQILARSIVDDLVEATVERQEALKAKQEREIIRRQEEENRGYRKPRILEAITEYIKNATHEELRAQEQLFSASNDWFQKRGQQLSILQKRKQAQEELARAEKTADYIAARRAKVDAIYAEREKEKQVKQQQVAVLREHRRREKIELASFVTEKKLAEEARAEEEFKATVALDAQRRRQVILAQVHKERMIEEKEKLHELGVKAARRRVLKEAKKEHEFEKRAEALEKKKQRRDEERKRQREKMMVLYEKALEVADAMRSSKSAHTPSGAKDPNETLKFAIGVYFSDPSNSMVASKTKKMMGDLMFAQKEGDLAWTEKRVEARLREIFQWMDKDGTGQVEQSELHGAFQRMGGNIKTSELEHLLASIDADGDGQLTLEEFIDFGKSVFAQKRDVSGCKVVDKSHPRLRTATPEIISSNKQEREERLEAARRVKRMEEEAKIDKALAVRARFAERRKFVDEAVQAYEKAFAEKIEAKDEEMVQMQRQDESARQRRSQSYEKLWLKQQKAEEEVIRSWSLRRAQSAGEKTAILKEEQRKVEKIRSTHAIFNYEKAITTEHLMSNVEGRRRMASPGFPVVTAPPESASRVMQEISSVYLAKPRFSSSSRPHTSLGFGEADGSDESAPSNVSHAMRSGEGQNLRTGNRLLLTAHDQEAAHKYFVRFGTKTKLGERIMPYHRFDRMLHSMKIAPLLLSEADVVNIFNLAIGADGMNNLYTENLTPEQFYKAVYHVSEWTGRSFLEMSLLGEQVQASFTNRHDWSTDLRASAYVHPLLSKSLENRSSGSLTSFAQSSLPVIHALSESLSTPLLGFDAPKSKKDYLKLRKHMRVASCTVVKPRGQIPEALERRWKRCSKGSESNVLDLDSHLNIGTSSRHINDSGMRQGDLQPNSVLNDDALPSVSPASERASQASSFLDASFSTVADRTLDASTGSATAELITPNMSLVPGEKSMLLASINALDEPPKPHGGERFKVSALPGGGGDDKGAGGAGRRTSKPFNFKLLK